MVSLVLPKASAENLGAGELGRALSSTKGGLNSSIVMRNRSDGVSSAVSFTPVFYHSLKARNGKNSHHPERRLSKAMKGRTKRLTVGNSYA